MGSVGLCGDVSTAQSQMTSQMGSVYLFSVSVSGSAKAPQGDLMFPIEMGKERYIYILVRHVGRRRKCAGVSIK